MQTIKLSSIAITCLCGVALCVYAQAQDANQAAAASTAVAAPTKADPNATPNPTISDPSETMFPHDVKSPPSNVVAPEIPDQTIWDGYDTHYAIEFGGRSVATTGNRDVSDTFVNLQSGVRLMDQSLQMHSVNHDGLLFDDLNLSSFGLGGDPNEVIRMRVNKHHWYDFSGSWRRDINFWDYNLLGNPLNPLTNNPAVPINVSPALLDLSRKMLDTNLILLPDWPVQVTLGYSHYTNGGSSYTTIHEATEAELYQPWRDSSDSVHAGVAWRPIERTRINVDEIYTHNKNENLDYLNSFPYSLSNGAPVNLGISWGNNFPCASPFTGSSVNPTCGLYTGYSDTTSYYTNIPTEQVGFESSYYRSLHVNGRFTYTGAETFMPNMEEIFNGYTSTRVQSVTTGRASIEQNTTSADAGLTYEITERLSFDDQFRWYQFIIPGAASFVQNYLFAASAIVPPNTFTSATCPPPYTASTCPQHGTSTSADETATNYSMFQSQNQKRNTAQLRYDFPKRVTANLGYRYEREDIAIDGSTSALASYFPNKPNRGSCTAKPVSGVCQASSSSYSSQGVIINTDGLIAGIAARPINGLRLNADGELNYSDNVFTNIMPRHMQLYRGKAIYTPKKWIDLNANVRIQEERDLAAGLGDLQHNRSFSFGVVFPISTRFGFEANYSYDNYLTNLNICFSETPTPTYAATTAICPSGYLTALSYYRNIDHFGSASFMVKPISRVTLNLGYTITSTNGSNLLLNPLAPLGPVAINYYLPTVSIAINAAKRITLKAGWNLFDYDEKSNPGPVAARNFESNVVSISLRYAM